MTSKERTRCAMNLQHPDRTPVMCQLSIGHMLRQLDVAPVDFWFDGSVFAEGLLRLRERYGFDGILVSLHGHAPDWKAKIAERTKAEDVERVQMTSGVIMTFPPDDLPTVEHADAPPRPRIADFDVHALPNEVQYIPVSQDLRFTIDLRHRFDAIAMVVANAGSEFSVHGEVTSPFDYLLDLLGHEEALMALIDHPQQCKSVLHHVAGSVATLAADMCSTGVDAIKISSPFAGAGFLSPAMYEEFVLPFEREVAQAIRANRVVAYLHTCGSIGDRLSLMLSSGVHGLECLDPPPLGNVELEEAVRLAGDKAFIKGNIDPVHTLLLGTRDEVLEDARRRIEAGKRAAGFILSSACSVPPHVSPENLRALREAVDRWG